MPYTINLTNGNLLTSIADATIDTSTSLQLLGRNFAGYGGILATDFVHLLENFANTSAPPSPLTGQLWYNSTAGALELWNGATWAPISAASGGLTITETTASNTGLVFYDPLAPVNSKHYRIRVRDDAPYAGHLVVESLNDDLSINTIVLDTDNIGDLRIAGRTSLLLGATAYGPGGWSSANVGKQMLLTSTASNNPGLGFTDITGSNLWGVYNTTGTLTFAAMPAYTDGATNPVPVLQLVSSGARGITQALSDNSTYLATTAFVKGNASGGPAGGAYYAVDSGAANAIVATLSPVPGSLAVIQGIPVGIKMGHTNTGATTLNANGLGATAVVDYDGRALVSGMLIANGIYTFIYNGTSFQVLTTSGTFIDNAIAGIQIDGSGNTSGGNLLLKGNGATTPNKYIRAFNGNLDFINNAYGAVIGRLSDLGDLSLIRNFSATTSTVGTALFGASGDFYCADNGPYQLLAFAANNYIQYEPGAGFAVNTTGQWTHIADAGYNFDALSASFVVNAAAGLTNRTGRVRAGVGARGSGDTYAATILGDYVFSAAGNGYLVLPNGFIIQWGAQSVPSGGGTYGYSFPLVFDVALGFVCNYGYIAPTQACGGQIVSTSTFYLTNNAQPSGGSDGIWWVALGY